MLNRRKFLWLSLAGTGGLLSFNYISKVSNMQLVLGRILSENLGGLKIDPLEIQRWTQDVVEKKSLNLSFASTQLLCMYQIQPLNTLLLPFNRKYQQLCTDITANFLLSTDFFLNKMDEQKEIRYSGMVYQTYKGACANPFSGLYYK